MPLDSLSHFSTLFTPRWTPVERTLPTDGGRSSPHLEPTEIHIVMHVLNVVGARPNFMKIAPLHRELERHGWFRSRLVHTGQHYDDEMSDVFFRQLGLPKPDVYLGVGSDTHARQTAAVMSAFEEVLLGDEPDLVVVVGDVNSTLAAALVASKLNIPVAHVEAGLRSGDRKMPEEINRIATDSIADLLFVTEESGMENLRREGVPEEKIHFVGNLMIDSLVRFREKAAESRLLEELGIEGGGHVAMTMHRPDNVDSPGEVDRMLRTIEAIAERMPVVFPVHPRTRKRIAEFGEARRFDRIDGLYDLEPLGYLDFLHLMDTADVVVTDSGGIQEETTVLGVPCLTLRSSTERPVTVERGTNELMKVEPRAVARRVFELSDAESDGRTPPMWDGRTAERIVALLRREPVPA